MKERGIKFFKTFPCMMDHRRFVQKVVFVGIAWRFSDYDTPEH